MSTENLTEQLNNSNGKFINQKIYDSLVNIAKYSLRNSPQHNTLRTSDVVSEALIKIYNRNENKFKSRGHFYSLMSHIMRNLVVDYARKKQACKNGGDLLQVTLSELDAQKRQNEYSHIKMLEIESAICSLGEKDNRLEEMVVMRFYGGLNIDVLAEHFKVSASTIKRQLRFAQAFLKARI